MFLSNRSAAVVLTFLLNASQFIICLQPTNAQSPSEGEELPQLEGISLEAAQKAAEAAGEVPSGLPLSNQGKAKKPTKQNSQSNKSNKSNKPNKSTSKNPLADVPAKSSDSSQAAASDKPEQPSTTDGAPGLTNIPALGPMPAIRPLPAAGDPPSWQVPDRNPRRPVRAETYKLAPGDRINVAMATVPEFSGVYQVMVDGRITLPVIGQVDVWGMTEPEAADFIAKRYTQLKVLVKPTITVVLAEMSNLHVAILGEINRPGAYLVTPQNGELPRLTQVIELAGGITQQTDLKQIRIRRPLRDGTDRTVNTNLWELLTTGDLSQDIAIRDGDTIFLPTAQAIPTEVALKVGQSNVAPQAIQVNIMGEVNAPGLQTLRRGTSLNQAIMQAGGFSQRAQKKKIELVRLNPNGTVSHRQIRIDLKKSIDEQLNPLLQDRDVIIVDRSLGPKISDTVGKILSPFNSIFALFNTFAPFFIRR